MAAELAPVAVALEAIGAGAFFAFLDVVRIKYHHKEGHAVVVFLRGWAVLGAALQAPDHLAGAILVAAGTFALVFRYALNAGMGWPLRHIGGTKHYDRTLWTIGAKLNTQPATLANWVEGGAVAIGTALSYI